MNIEDVINHIRNRPYMSGVERDLLRVKSTGEVFTPTNVVIESLNKLPQEYFSDPEQPFVDPSCGDGQYLGEVIIKKMQNGLDFETALSTTYGVDIMEDNVKLCRDRLLCGQEHMRHIVEKNIVCCNALTYDYEFKDTKTFGNGLFVEEN
jgi:hypothetical protein